MINYVIIVICTEKTSNNYQVTSVKMTESINVIEPEGKI